MLWFWLYDTQLKTTLTVVVVVPFLLRVAVSWAAPCSMLVKLWSAAACMTGRCLKHLWTLLPSTTRTSTRMTAWATLVPSAPSHPLLLPGSQYLWECLSPLYLPHITLTLGRWVDLTCSCLFVNTAWLALKGAMSRYFRQFCYTQLVLNMVSNHRKTKQILGSCKEMRMIKIGEDWNRLRKGELEKWRPKVFQV